MHELSLSCPSVPEGFEDYLETVNSLVESSGVREGVAYLTIDEKLLQPGQTQRKPGPHIDGCFLPSKNRWGGGGGGGGWNHSCNIIPDRMPVIVASNYPLCKAWEGIFDGQPSEDGDMSHVELGHGIVLPQNQGFLLSPDCVHESLPAGELVNRSFVRLAMPVGSYN